MKLYFEVEVRPRLRLVILECRGLDLKVAWETVQLMAYTVAIYPTGTILHTISIIQ